MSTMNCNNNNAHWATELIGLPYSSGGSDLYTGFDCWGLFRYVQKHHFNRDLPPVNVDTSDVLAVAREFRDNEQRSCWALRYLPMDGDAVLMAHARYPSHVGVWLDIDGGGVLHAVKGMGVIYSNLSALKLSGWGRIEYYRYKGDNDCKNGGEQ